MNIDSHTHVLSEKPYQEYMEKSKGQIDKIMAFGFFYQDMEELYKFTSSKNNLYLVGSIDMDKDVSSQLVFLEEWLKEKKICGIKLYPGYQYFRPSDEKVFPVAKLCQKYQKPLIFHCGDFYDVRGFTNLAVLKYSHPAHVDELAAKFPDCPIIMAHLGFPNMLEAALIASKNPRVYTDLSGTIDKQATPEDTEKLLTRYVEDLRRVYAYYPGVREKSLFGTDFSGTDTILSEAEPYFELINRVFTQTEKSKVMGELAQKLFFD